MPCVASHLVTSVARCVSSPRTALRLRMHVVRVDVMRARTLPSPTPLTVQVMWTICELKDKCYLAVARFTAGLSVPPGLVRLSARGPRPGHAAVREVSSSRVLGVSLTP